MQVKKKSQLQEKSVAKSLNAKPVIASGALWGSKGDVRHDDYLVECKTTDKPVYPLKMSVWHKIATEALHDGMRTPVMCIDLNGGKERYAVFKEKDFIHYKSYSFIAPNCEAKWVDGKSFRISGIDRVLVLDKARDVFDIIPWDDFLYMIKGGIDSGT